MWVHRRDIRKRSASCLGTKRHTSDACAYILKRACFQLVCWPFVPAVRAGSAPMGPIEVAIVLQIQQFQSPLPQAHCTPKCSYRLSTVTKKGPSRRKKHNASRHSSVSLVAGLGAIIGDLVVLEVSRRTIDESLIITCSLLALITVSIGGQSLASKPGTAPFTRSSTRGERPKEKNERIPALY